MASPSDQIFTLATTLLAVPQDTFNFKLSIPINDNRLWWGYTIPSCLILLQQGHMENTMNPLQSTTQFQSTSNRSNQLNYLEWTYKTRFQLLGTLKVQVAHV